MSTRCNLVCGKTRETAPFRFGKRRTLPTVGLPTMGKIYTGIAWMKGRGKKEGRAAACNGERANGKEGKNERRGVGVGGKGEGVAVEKKNIAGLFFLPPSFFFFFSGEFSPRDNIRHLDRTERPIKN